MKRTIRKRVPSVLRRAERRLQAPGFAMALTAPTLSQVLVTPQTSLTFTAVYAAIRVLSEDSASLPLEVFRALPEGGSKVERAHPAYQLVTVSPDGECTDMNWRESWHAHCLGWGNGYSEIERDKAGRPIGLHLLHPSTTEPKRTEAGKLFYQIDNQNKKLTPDKVLHLAGLGFNGLSGYSPIALAREAIGLGKAAEEFGAALFGNGAIPKGILKHPKRLSEAAQANLRRTFNERHQGPRNAHQVAILEEGMDWVNTQIAPDDAQFLATRQFQIIEIARIYRVPPNKLQDYSQAHLANVEEANLDYLMTSLRPWLIRIEKVLNFRLLTAAERAAGYYFKHDMRALLRANSKDRAEYYTKLFGIGIYSADEIRALEDLNPLGTAAGGDKHLVPLNMTTLEAAGQLPAPKERS